MNTSNGPVRPTPTNLNPLDDICLQLSVPNDPEWIAAFYDALYQLTLWMAWQRDDAHTGKDIAARWWKTLNSVQLCKEVQAPNGCPDPGDDYLLRQNPDNPCLIETSADGTHWCTLIDLTLCIPATGQPGGGATQPAPGGGSACYQGAMHANEIWLLPTVVNSGDVLSFNNPSGAGSDGTLHWYCPTGSVYFAGACVGSLSFNGGDPDPAIHHMALVAKIGSVYYDITAGPITVPGGIINEQVTVQVNDGSLSGNSGDYTFEACVVNNSVGTWESTLDFTLQPYSSIHTGGLGTWVAGTGYQGVSNGFQPYVIQPAFDFSAAEITGYEIHYNCSAHSGTGDGAGIYIVATSSGYMDGVTPLVNGTNVVRSGTGDKPGATEVQPTLNSGGTGSQVTMTKLILRGKGTKPPQLP